MKKILHLLYQPYKWLIYAPLVIVSVLVFALIIVIVAFVINGSVASKFAAIWARFNAFIIPMMVKVSGKENIKKNASYVIVANHQSHYDILVLYGWIGIDVKWVMKKELRKVPALGLACEKMGHVFLDRANKDVAIQSLNDAKKKLVNGTSVIIFPEGTRSETEKVEKFKAGAFRLALDLGLPILPVTISGTRDIMPAGTTDLLPGKAYMKIHAPVEVNEYNLDTLPNLMENVRGIIAR